ncbi:hypothetical protein FQA39_LY01049 [Lamprigera yunnana]|nr:hypothetical protein FQA39_LY01049 [Lamprigera yunnana]
MSTTVDPEEATFYNRLSDVWWTDPKLEVLKNIAYTIVPYICSQTISTGIANNSSENGSGSLRDLEVLEVGCGGGFLSEHLARTGCNLTSIDVAVDLLYVAKQHATNDPTLPAIQYLNEAIEDHCKKNYQKYDIVASNFVLEHVNEPDYFIKCCSQCVKPTGSLFISTIAKTFWAWFIIIFLSEYLFRIIPIGSHFMNKFINATTTEGFIKSS